jgi:hypothetical protein
MGADRPGIQCCLTQHVGIALACFRKLDDPSGDCFIGKVGSACVSNSCTSYFECDAQEAPGLRINVLAV